MGDTQTYPGQGAGFLNRRDCTHAIVWVGMWKLAKGNGADYICDFAKGSNVN